MSDIVLDPGHTGTAAAANAVATLREAALTDDLAEQASRRCLADHDVAFTRTASAALETPSRSLTRRAEKHLTTAAPFLSLHFNATAEGTRHANGASVLVAPDVTQTERAAADEMLDAM